MKKYLVLILVIFIILATAAANCEEIYAVKKMVLKVTDNGKTLQLKVSPAEWWEKFSSKPIIPIILPSAIIFHSEVRAKNKITEGDAITFEYDYEKIKRSAYGYFEIILEDGGAHRPLILAKNISDFKLRVEGDDLKVYWCCAKYTYRIHTDD